MFRNKSLIAILFAGVTAFLTSCDKDEHIEKIVTPPAEVKFTVPIGTIGKYFITSSPNTAFKIPVGFTNVSDKDRTITFTYSSPTGAEQGTHYTAPQSITIPAGQAVDTLEIKGLFNTFPTGRKDTLKISVSSPDAPTANSDNKYTVLIQKYCEVDLANIAGDYTVSSDLYGGDDYGPYTVTITDVTPISATKASAKLEHLGEAVFGEPTDPVNIILDWTDPANFKITIPEGQHIIAHDYYGYGPVNIIDEGSTFSSCDKTFTLNYEITVAAGSFGSVTTTIK